MQGSTNATLQSSLVQYSQVTVEYALNSLTRSYCDGKAAIDALLNLVCASAGLTFRQAIIFNADKDDVFTALSDSSYGFLTVYESDALWVNHPNFVLIDAFNYIYLGTLELTN